MHLFFFPESAASCPLLLSCRAVVPFRFVGVGQARLGLGVVVSSGHHQRDVRREEGRTNGMGDSDCRRTDTDAAKEDNRDRDHDCDHDDLGPWLLFQEPEEDEETDNRPASSRRLSSSSSGGGDLCYTEPETVRRVYQLGRLLSQVLDQEGVHYWTSGGTTLGLVRHGGLIPWDDDLDFCIVDTDEHLLSSPTSALAKRLAEHGLVVVRANTFGFRVFHQSESQKLPRDELINYRYPFCDLFVLCKEKKRYELKYRTARVLWPHERYPSVHVAPAALRRLPFADYTLPCPANAEAYLDAMYGKEWRHVGATAAYDHVTRERTTARHFDMEDNMFKPAVPFR